MRELVIDALIAFDWFILVYFVILNSVYLALVLLGATAVGRSRRWEPLSDLDAVFANSLTPAATVIAPAFNEEVSIVESVRSMIGLRYPRLEVIVIDDGSTDATFELLRDEFDLRPVVRAIPDEVPTIGEVRSVHAAREVNITVIRKDNAGMRSDPINVGINAARTPLVCIVDADSVLDADSLLRIARPFVDDPVRTVAAGGVIRAANGARVERGAITDVRMPRRWLARVQVVEYLRSFLLGRTGWARIGGLMIISGAFGLFRRDVLVEVGGLDLETLGEDAELTTRIHRTMREQRREYRVAFVAEPVCWTEVPEDERSLSRQRARWSRGAAEVIWTHRRMVGNPRYGVMGTITLPFFLLFEVLGPVVELLGLAALTAGIVFGLVDAQFTLLIAGVAFGYGILLSVAAITVEEFSYRRYPHWRDLLITIAAGVVEWFGYRQLHLWWRILGLVDFLRGRPAKWGAMRRAGFDAAA